MLKSMRWLLWTGLFLIMLLAVDQFFVQVPPLHPAHGAVSRFYQDFRSRLGQMVFDPQSAPPAVVKKPAAPTRKPPKSIEAIIAQQAKTADPKTVEKAQRYVYSDADGQLQFADSLEAIPEKFRALAQPLSR